MAMIRQSKTSREKDNATPWAHPTRKGMIFMVSDDSGPHQPLFVFVQPLAHTNESSVGLARDSLSQ